jgi:hypothetical protein
LYPILEALKPIVDALAEFFDEDTRDSVKELLESNKRQSVNKMGKELAARLSGEYGGKEPKKYFTDSYNVRSGLAHGNPRSERTKEAMQQQFSELLRFVLDI